MQRQIYTEDIIEYSLEQHVARHSKRGNGIYTTILLLLFAAAAGLPFIRVDVTVQTNGIVRPVLEEHEVTTAMDGYVDSFPVRETQEVQLGQLLLRLRDPIVRERLAVDQAQVEQQRRFIRDLEVLATSDAPLGMSPDSLETPSSVACSATSARAAFSTKPMPRACRAPAGGGSGRAPAGELRRTGGLPEELSENLRGPQVQHRCRRPHPGRQP